MLDIMYEIPKDDNIGMVTITKSMWRKRADRSLPCVAVHRLLLFRRKLDTLLSSYAP